MNPYLKNLRAQYASMQASVEGLQTRAAEEDRPLSEDEMTGIRGMAAKMRDLLSQIEELEAVEERNAKFKAREGDENSESNDEPFRSGRGHQFTAGISLGASVRHRDPGHYRAASEGGQHSFYGDMVRAAVLQDSAAQARLAEHNTFMRSETTSTIAGVVPPKWLADQFTTMAQQDRALANAVANYAIADARPFTLPGQTANTTVGNQPTGENGALVDSDAYNATGVVITPSTVVGKETVSRQLLDASTPAIDQLILADLTASYNAEIEKRIGAAIRAIGTPLSAALSEFVDPTDVKFGYDLAVEAAMAVRKAMYLRPTHFAMDYDTFAGYLKLKDADGRPIVVASNAGPVNVVGVAGVDADGWIAGVPVVLSAGMEPVSPGDSGDYAAAMIHGPSIALFESPQLSFRYEERSGPQSIEIGLWRYAAVAVRQGTRAVKNLLVDDDS